MYNAFCILYHSYFSIFTDTFSSLKVFFAFFDQMVANIGPAMLCHTAANTLGSAAAGPNVLLPVQRLSLSFAFLLLLK